MHKRYSALRQIRESYVRLYRTIILSFSVFVVSGVVLLSLYLYTPTTPSGSVYLNIGSALLTGAIFSLVLPMFLGGAGNEPVAPLSVSAVYAALSNRNLGLGRVWANEDAFSSDFDFVEFLSQRSWEEAVIVGTSATRYLATFGHVIEKIYAEEPMTRWRPFYFIIADPESIYTRAHLESPYGRRDVVTDIRVTIDRVTQIREAVALIRKVPVDSVPIFLRLTNTQIRFGVLSFRGLVSIVTLYRYGSRSYFNPRFEVLHSLVGSGEVTALGRWIDEYLTAVTHASKEREEGKETTG